MGIKASLTVKTPGKYKDAKDIAQVLRILADTEVLVGVPEETTDKRNEDGQEYITNAALAHIHDQGAPEAGIPARPFMEPGIKKVEDNLLRKLKRAANLALTGDAVKVEMVMHEIGLTAQTSIQNTIAEGIPPPLADATLRERARKANNRSKLIAKSAAKSKRKL